MKKSLIVFILILAVLTACSGSADDMENTQGTTGINIDQNPDIPDGNGLWRIDKNLVFDGGPGKDGIPALLDPELINADQATYLQDDDLVLGLKHNGKFVAFPHRILDWHEIINIQVEDLALAVTYCPLTGSGYGWNRKLGNITTTFGVSGLIYKNNLIPYDRATDSNWSQFKLECVNGELAGDSPELTFLPEMKWGLWKQMYPETEVVSTNTGYNRDYFEYPYGNYKTNNTYIIFPSDDPIHSIPVKERVYSIISGNVAKVYRFSAFGQGAVLRDNIKGQDYILVGNPDFIVSFVFDEAFSDLEFSYNHSGSEIILKDNEGNSWNIFGEATKGPRKGQFLGQSPISWMSYYFAIESFYPGLTIYQ